MNIQELLVGILESFVANLPQFAMFAFLFITNLSEMKKKVSMFSSSVENSEKSILTVVETKVSNLLTFTTNKIENTINKVDKLVEETNDKIDTFSKRIDNLGVFMEQVFKTNKVAFDIISLLISGNDKFVDSGVASIVVNKMRLSKEELEKYPNLLATDKETFANAMKEQYIILGKENFEQLIYDTLMEIGDYGKEK